MDRQRNVRLLILRIDKHLCQADIGKDHQGLGYDCNFGEATHAIYSQAESPCRRAIAAGGLPSSHCITAAMNSPRRPRKSADSSHIDGLITRQLPKAALVGSKTSATGAGLAAGLAGQGGEI